MGRFFVTMEDAKRYADGYKVSFSIGNPQAATYSGVKLDIKWGKRIPDTRFLDDETAKKLEITLDRDLRPGTWNHVSVVVAPATSDEIGAFEVKISVPRVFLNRSVDVSPR